MRNAGACVIIMDFAFTCQKLHKKKHKDKKKKQEVQAGWIDTLRYVIKSSKSCRCRRSSSHSASTARAARSMMLGLRSVSITSITRQEKVAGKGQLKMVRNHCEAYSTGTAPKFCRQAVAQHRLSYIAPTWQHDRGADINDRFQRQDPCGLCSHETLCTLNAQVV